MAMVECTRCGYEWEVTTVRKNHNLCASCRARKVQSVHTVKGKCIPWHGHFAPDQITPVDDDGEIVMPGLRACGHSDCVSPNHVIDSQ